MGLTCSHLLLLDLTAVPLGRRQTALRKGHPREGQVDPAQPRHLLTETAVGYRLVT
jgi:hypothetical protein